MADSDDPRIFLADANGRFRDTMCHPWLVFDKSTGTVFVADDYEVSNDATARDFVLTKDDAVNLAAALHDYVMHGTTSKTECVSKVDVKGFLQRGGV